MSGLQGSGGCIQLDVKYEGGTSDWEECGDCITADSDEVVLAEQCPQKRKRRRRAVRNVDEVQAKFCRTSDSVTLCSDPITPKDGKSKKGCLLSTDTIVTKLSLYHDYPDNGYDCQLAYSTTSELKTKAL